MSKQQLATAITTALLTTGVALAVGQASWNFFRSDLVRCADATASGNPACGSAVTGTDPLKDGRVSMTDSRISLRLHGALPNETYDLVFISLENTGTNFLGPYSASGTTIGSITTNRNGTATATYSAGPLNGRGPELGYFLVSKDQATNEFVTGFDPFVPNDDD